MVPQWAKGVNQGEGRNLIPLNDNWSLKSFTYEHDQTGFNAHIIGIMDDMEVIYELQVNGNGNVVLDYSIPDMPKAAHEVGLNFTLTKQMNRISWKRKGQWSVYPEGHIGRLKGTADRYSDFTDEQYRKQPQKGWEQDGKDFYLFQKMGTNPDAGVGTHDFRATRLNLTDYSVYNSNGEKGIRIMADGELAARCAVNLKGEVVLKALNHITYSDLGWGNYVLPSKVDKKFSGRLSFNLSFQK